MRVIEEFPEGHETKACRRIVLSEIDVRREREREREKEAKEKLNKPARTQLSLLLHQSLNVQKEKRELET